MMFNFCTITFVRGPITFVRGPITFVRGPITFVQVSLKCPFLSPDM